MFYPGGYSETEIHLPYAATIFSSKLGRLAGNHFLTVEEGKEDLRRLGEMCLWEGAQDIVFERARAPDPRGQRTRDRTTGSDVTEPDMTRFGEAARPYPAVRIADFC